MSRLLFVCLGLALGTVMLYLPVRNYEFLNFDDGTYIVENRHVTSGLQVSNFVWAFTQSHSSNWHPLTWISHMIDCQLWGLDAGKHHLTNAALHAANAVLLFLVLLRLTHAPPRLRRAGQEEEGSRFWKCAFVAAVFAWHPLHVESVAWVSERKDVLSTFFWLLTMGAYVRYARLRVRGSRFPVGSFLGVVLFLVLGLMSKPMLVTLPFVLLLLDYWPLGRMKFPTPSSYFLIIEKLPLFLLSATSCVVTYLVQNEAGATALTKVTSLNERALNALVGYGKYLKFIFWPEGLAVIYPFEWAISWGWLVSSCILVAGLSLLSLKTAATRPYLAVGWFWFLGTLVPVSGLVQVGGHAIADRYMYVPLIGLSIMVAWGMAGLFAHRPHGRWVLGLAAVAALAACVVVSAQQIRFWKNDLTLFGRALQVTSNNWVAHVSIGPALARADRVDEAIEHYRKSLRIMPDFPVTQRNLGAALAKQGQFAAAIEAYKGSMRFGSETVENWMNMGHAFTGMHALDEARNSYQRALQVDPDHAPAYVMLGNLALTQGDSASAMSFFARALESGDVTSDALLGLASASALRGDWKQAIEFHERNLALNPENSEALARLAGILAGASDAHVRDGERALEIARQGCELTGFGDPAHLDALAMAHAETRNYGEARKTARKALELAIEKGDQQLAGEIRARLELYQLDLPFHYQ